MRAELPVHSQILVETSSYMGDVCSGTDIRLTYWDRCDSCPTFQKQPAAVFFSQRRKVDGCMLALFMATRTQSQVNNDDCKHLSINNTSWLLDLHCTVTTGIDSCQSTSRCRFIENASTSHALFNVLLENIVAELHFLKQWSAATASGAFILCCCLIFKNKRKSWNITHHHMIVKSASHPGSVAFWAWLLPSQPLFTAVVVDHAAVSSCLIRLEILSLMSKHHFICCYLQHVF